MTGLGAVRPLATATQARLWAAEQLTPGTGELNVPVALRLRGPLDSDALVRALRALAARHESLRSTFALDTRGRLRWTAHGPEHFRVEVVDLTDRPDPHAAAQRLVEDVAWRPFDLASEVLRTAVLTLAPDDHVLVCAGHHVVFDDWSVAVFFRELEVLYAAALRGLDGARMLPPLAFGYTELSFEEQRLRSRGTLDDQVAYWAGQLAGAEPVAVPADRPRPAVRTAHADEHAFALPGPLVTRLTEVGRACGASPFMTLLAGFHALLRRWTGQTDITVGTLVTGRTTPEREKLITCLVNTLAIRSTAPKGVSFVDLLTGIRQRTLDAFAHQEAPYDQVVAALPEPAAGRRPLVQVTFELQNTTTDVAALRGGRGELPVFRGLATTAHPVPRLTARHDLELALGTGAGDAELSGRVVYPTDLFDAGTITAVVRDFRTLLDEVAADPHRPV
ncbi:condensation domain-containing protein [Streptomyces sp. NPDC057579]|uniref:condensation domain-containing protein n=1 Tax=unclassified Streptomyces TaxID=2593676 RepID=UPI0036943715